MRIWKFCAVAVVLLALVVPVQAEVTKGGPLRDSDKKWLEEVYWIISDYEKNAFVSLKGDEDRDRFIAAFWENRDPTPGTKKNEFKDEHYRRFEYANKMFGRTTPIPGWKTDRGKIYILMGEPEFIKRKQNSFEVYPAELWQYAGHRDFGIPSSVYFLFFQEKGIGDYRLYSPIQDGIRSLFVQTSQMVMKTETEMFDLLQETVDPQIAHAAFSSIPTEGGNPYDAGTGQLTAEMIEAKVENAKNYDLDKRKYVEDFIVERPRVTIYTSIDSGGIRDGVFWFQGPNRMFYVDYAVEYEPDKLDMGQYDNNYYTSLTVDGSVATTDKVQVEQILSSHEINLKPDQFDKVKSHPFQFQGRRPLYPGKYEFTLILNNNVSRRSITFTHDLDIPNPELIVAPVISPVLPLRRIEKMASGETKLRPFQFGDQLATPNIPATYSQGKHIEIYHQVLFPAKFVPGDGNLTLHYSLSAGGKTEAEVTQSLSPSAEELAGNSIDIRAEIPLHNTTLGVKQLNVELRAGDRVIAGSEPVVINIESNVGNGPWKYGVALPDYDSPYHSFAVAQQLMKMNKTKQALAVLEAAYRSHPESLEIRLQLMDAALRSEKFQIVLDLGGSVEVKNPRDRELLWMLGWANYGLEKYEEAVKFFERYRIEDPKKLEVLNLLADIYFRLNQKDKSMERVQQSLALKPNQQEMIEFKKKLEQP